MTTQQLQLIEWADKYETKEFIKNDPIQFPHRYEKQQDIEISAFVTSWLSYGKRDQIIKAAEKIDGYFKVAGGPYAFIMNREYKPFMDLETCCYRLFTWHDFYCLCEDIYKLYEEYSTMLDFVYQSALKRQNTDALFLSPLVERFRECVGIPKTTVSACKRLCMFLRWMVRGNSSVDLGTWSVLSPQYLVIPLDTHVHRIALQLGLTQRKSADYKAALEITRRLSKTFQYDPCKGDFALFGYGVNNQ